MTTETTDSVVLEVLADETLQLTISDADEIIVATTAEQGPAGPAGPKGDDGQGINHFSGDPLAYYILAKA